MKPGEKTEVFDFVFRTFSEFIASSKARILTWRGDDTIVAYFFVAPMV
jgi:hypothetical protein